MNGNFRPPSDRGSHDGLDPELMELFDTAAATPPLGAPQAASSAEFVRSVLLKMQQARRLRLFWQIGGRNHHHVGKRLPGTSSGASRLSSQPTGSPIASRDRQSSFVWPLGYMCLSLFIWRIARRARTYCTADPQGVTASQTPSTARTADSRDPSPTAYSASPASRNATLPRP